MKQERLVAVITGGSMGLGFALAQVLLQEGWDVAICARNEQRLSNAVERLGTFGGRVKGYAGDVANPSFQAWFVDSVIRDFGRIDAVVNNASILGDLPMPQVSETSVENLRAVFEANTFAPIALLQRCIPYLKVQPGSLGISISSDAAIGGYPGWGVYGSSKAALDLLHKTAAAEMEDSGITLFAIDPSDMDTAMHHAASPGDEGLNDPVHVARTIAQLFQCLSLKREFPFASGTRLQVQGDTLVAKEVG